ncbi:MAG: hypothetical protein A2X64_01075 [Ignavibacteria bacterium GWF2_33_9]|nr:MAG: hypothetical protein A2X64_01075 [Ignavibacteria bacterium GWF2_33_9]
MDIFQEKISELRLQKAVQQFLSDPSQVYTLESGLNVQILSPGRINPYKGPDFLDIAILLNGKIIVGDAEFHHCSSLWRDHQHSLDENFNTVILHIVLDHDCDLGLPFHTLVVPEKEMVQIYHTQIKKHKSKPDLFSLEELQNYSLIRLLRHTTEAQKLVNGAGLDFAIKSLTDDFLQRYMAKKRRPSYTQEKIADYPDYIISSKLTDFVRDIAINKRFSIPDKLITLVKEKDNKIGIGLRREIMLNVIVPCALTQADEHSRINIFSWYWSSFAMNKYGILTRKFPELPQNFLWQQQGMLEYMREIESGSNTISEALAYYGIGKLLTFFQWGPGENI